MVQHLVGMAVKRKAHRAMLVTTGRFTNPARTQAEDFDVELIGGQALASLMARHPALVAALGVGDGYPSVEPAPFPTNAEVPMFATSKTAPQAPSDAGDYSEVAFAVLAIVSVGTGIWLLLDQPSLIGFASVGLGIVIWLAWVRWPKWPRS